MLHALNLYSDVCQLYPNKTEKLILLPGEGEESVRFLEV